MKKMIIDCLQSTKTFVKHHPDLLISNADKGNVTVILDRDSYIASMEAIFSDVSTYSYIERDPSRILTRGSCIPYSLGGKIKRSLSMNPRIGG